MSVSIGTDTNLFLIAQMLDTRSGSLLKNID